MAVSYERKEARKILTKISDYVVKRLKQLAPYDTGNLRNESIVKIRVSVDKAVIYVNLEQAPYMSYTNEPWIAERWKGKKNPNEAWWNNAIEQIMKEVQEKFGGRKNA